MHKRKWPHRPQRILTFEEFTATPRTEAELASYWHLVEHMKAAGLIDDNLKVTDLGKRHGRR